MAADDDDQHGQASIEGSSLDTRRVILIGAGLVAAFGGLALWGLLDDPVDASPRSTAAEDIEPGSEEPGEKAAESGDIPPLPTREPELAPEPLEQGRLLVKSRQLPGLLVQQFQRVRPDGSTSFTALRNVLPAARGVTVINVWATYCEPCKREFPGFSALQKGWGNNVRFVPIQLGEGDGRALRAIMPEAPDLLVDYTPGGAVQAELAKVGELPTNAPIPITMLLDCQQDLRWVQQGEVTDMQAFDRAVQDLRDELRTPRCAVKTQPVATATPAPTPADACRNPKCKPNQTCELRASDGTYHCLDGLE